MAARVGSIFAAMIWIETRRNCKVRSSLGCEDRQLMQVKKLEISFHASLQSWRMTRRWVFQHAAIDSFFAQLRQIVYQKSSHHYSTASLPSQAADTN